MGVFWWVVKMKFLFELMNIFGFLEGRLIEGERKVVFGVDMFMKR